MTTIPAPSPATAPEREHEDDRCVPDRSEMLRQRLEENKHPIGATAQWPGDDLCHWYRSTTQTLCGIVHEPVSSFHKQPPCPNGNEPCQHCVSVHDG